MWKQTVPTYESLEKKHLVEDVKRILILKTVEKAVVRYDQDTFITHFCNVFHIG